MSIPASAVRFAGSLDPSEVLDYVVRMSSLLDEDEGIDPDPGRWSLSLLPEATLMGLELVEGDADWPDPELVEDDKAVRFWMRVNVTLQSDPAFQAGIGLPMEVTFWTNSTPPRRRQRTVVLTVMEQ